jgi:hypothetical protein
VVIIESNQVLQTLQVMHSSAKQHVTNSATTHKSMAFALPAE